MIIIPAWKLGRGKSKVDRVVIELEANLVRHERTISGYSPRRPHGVFKVWEEPEALSVPPEMWYQ